MDKPSDEVFRIADQVAALAFGRSGESLSTYGLDSDGCLGDTSCVINGEDGQYWRRLLRCVAVTAINRARVLPVRQPTPEAAAAAEKLKSCQCTADGLHLCAMCGQQIPETVPVEPDADGQVRPMGARMFGCSVCGEMYADPTKARECCTDDERDQT